MTRSSSSQLELFDPKIEITFHRLRNLVEARVSSKKERQEMDEPPQLELPMWQELVMKL